MSAAIAERPCCVTTWVLPFQPIAHDEMHKAYRDVGPHCTSKRSRVEGNLVSQYSADERCQAGRPWR